MTGLATLFEEGKLAVVNGVGYPNHSLSHFEAEAVWWAGNPNPQGTGWMGRYLDASLPLDVTHALSFGGDVNPTFTRGQRRRPRRARGPALRPARRPGGRVPTTSRTGGPAWAQIYGDARDPAEHGRARSRARGRT